MDFLFCRQIYNHVLNECMCVLCDRVAQYQRIASMSLAGAACPSERPVSRDVMEDFWSEMKNIEEDAPGQHEEMMERGSMDGT